MRWSLPLNAWSFRVLVCILCLAAIGHNTARGQDKVAVDVVFTLDLSGSTNGLVDDVRDQLWDIINQVSTYRPEVQLRIGVVAFSRPSFGRDNGYVKILSELTSAYELPALELARLKPSIEKGDQLVGTALKVSVMDMNWSGEPGAIKVIFLAGNGNVNLEGFKYRDAYEEASRSGIVINTIYCYSSNYRKEIFRWREIATSTGGKQYDLKVHHRNPLILTCKDEERLHDLAQRLERTYVWFGKYGRDARNMVRMLDGTARAANEQSYQSRLFYKLSGHFQSRQHQWDLVDYVKKTNSDFRELDFEWLPDSLKHRTPVELKSLVMRLKDERLRIISQMRALLQFDRQQIINEHVREKEYDRTPNTMDRIVISWLNEAATKKGITCYTN